MFFSFYRFSEQALAQQPSAPERRGEFQFLFVLAVSFAGHFDLNGFLLIIFFKNAQVPAQVHQRRPFISQL